MNHTTLTYLTIISALGTIIWMKVNYNMGLFIYNKNIIEYMHMNKYLITQELPDTNAYYSRSAYV